MIVESDMGCDFDDVLAICYLAAAGAKIDAIVVTPGHSDQLAVARLLVSELGLNIPIGMHKWKVKEPNGVHRDLLNYFGKPLNSYADAEGRYLIENSDEVFVIGPPSNVGSYLMSGGMPPRRLLMQGGFLPYSRFSPKERLDKFEGKEWMPTFNMNGDRKGTQAILDADIKERRFCGKNVCHTVWLTPDKLINFKPKNRAGELFVQAAKILGRDKKIHDPVAACCHLHPEIGTWVRGKSVKMADGWSTTDGDDWILADLDRDKFWELLYDFR